MKAGQHVHAHILHVVSERNICLYINDQILILMYVNGMHRLSDIYVSMDQWLVKSVYTN